MITREKLKQYINEMPEEISIDELIERLIFIEKLEVRITESKTGKLLTEEELKADVQKWFE
jgi:hypothetical protein